LINTDAVDNSGGVDMSDHEVNIKILMDLLVKKGVIKGKAERNAILAEMTEEVADLVLADNRNQALCITLDGVRSVGSYEEYVGVIGEMVTAGVLNRADESVPMRNELLRSAHRERGLPRPLLAVLLGYTKMYAFNPALETDLPDSDLGRPLLAGYFPKRLRDSFGAYFAEHPLRREIVGTVAVNYVVNNAGIALIQRLTAATSANVGSILAAYLEVDRTAEAPTLRERIHGSGLPAGAELTYLLELEEILEILARTRLAGGETSDACQRLTALKSRL
jgi:glutamate dehydrogenase